MSLYTRYFNLFSLAPLSVSQNKFTQKKSVKLVLERSRETHTIVYKKARPCKKPDQLTTDRRPHYILHTAPPTTDISRYMEKRVGFNVDRLYCRRQCCCLVVVPLLLLLVCCRVSGLKKVDLRCRSQAWSTGLIHCIKRSFQVRSK